MITEQVRPTEKEREFLLLPNEEKKRILGEAIDSFFTNLKDRGVSYPQYTLLVEAMATANLKGTPNEIDARIIVYRDKDLDIEKDEI